MPDTFVFPGGAVDPADRTPEALTRLRGTPREVAPEVAVAALRELFEEAGVLIACGADGRPAEPAHESLATLRARLAGGEALSALLERETLWLDARELVRYSNWITPESEPIRFDAHFFIARAPHGQEALADATEVHDGRWLAPAEALALAERGEMNMIFPTLKHLERLAAYDGVEALLQHARERSIVPVMPRVFEGKRIDFDGSDVW